MDEVTQALVDARALILEESTWAQGALARDACGRRTHLESEDAVCFCAWGALRKTLPYGARGRELSLFDHATIRLGRAARQVLRDSNMDEKSVIPVPLVNDRLGHAATIRMYDIAIAEAA